MRNPKTVFWTTYWLTFVVLNLVFAVSLVFVDRWFFDFKRHLGGMSGTMLLPFVVLSTIAANLVCGRLGLSQAERKVEIVKRGEAAMNLADPTTVELRYPSEIWAWIRLFSGAV